MITYQQFLDKYNGKYVDYDKKYGYQCVDLFRQYVVDCFGLSPYTIFPAADYAKTIYKNYTASSPFKKIPYTPTNTPKSGDIIFWNFYPGVIGWPGHVGIVVGDGASMYNFISFDQNWSPTYCHRQLHSYKGVMGWLRKV